MCKRVIFLLTLFFFLTIPVYAHLTGAFSNFLAVVYDEATIEKLNEEMQRTKEEIEELTPKVATAERAFKADRTVAIEQLQFYSEVGLDTWLALMHQGEDIVDLLGNQWVMSNQINLYLEDLNELYRQYQVVLNSQQTLQGHEELLQAIKKNLQAREAYLAETAGLELEIIANYLDIDWTAEVEAHIIADLQLDADTVNAGLVDWVTTSASLPYRLDESWLNERSNARYYFRNDHVYVEYELEHAHVLALGQILQNEQGTAADFIIEAGFYNGFFLPEELLEELPGFSLDYAAVQTLAGVTSPYFVQNNGSLQLNSK